MRLYGKGQHDLQSHVSEDNSPVRVTGMADKMGLIPGLAMDLTTCDEFGNPWDFNVEAMRAKAKKIIKSKAALLLIVSPMCSAFSRLQAFFLRTQTCHGQILFDDFPSQQKKKIRRAS